jgi:MFS family permease
VVPYGILADIYGRKLISSLGLIGLVLGDLWTVTVLILYRVFPFRAALASTAFQLIGGGNAVMISVMLAIIADVATSENRTQVFFYINVVFLVTELVAPPIGSQLSKAVGPHLTFLFTLPFALIGLVVLRFIPETLNPTNHNPGIEPEPFNIRKKFESINIHLRESILPLLNRPLLFIALMALFVNRLSRPILAMLLQYMSAKFHWKLEQVT